MGQHSAEPALHLLFIIFHCPSRDFQWTSLLFCLKDKVFFPRTNLLMTKLKLKGWQRFTWSMRHVSCHIYNADHTWLKLISMQVYQFVCLTRKSIEVTELWLIGHTHWLILMVFRVALHAHTQCHSHDWHCLQHTVNAMPFIVLVHQVVCCVSLCCVCWVFLQKAVRALSSISINIDRKWLEELWCHLVFGLVIWSSLSWPDWSGTGQQKADLSDSRPASPALLGAVMSWWECWCQNAKAASSNGWLQNTDD